MQCDKNPQKIQNMFNEISTYYDMMNNIISLGTHYLVKDIVIRNLRIQPDTYTLDLCCGTGDFTHIISKLTPQAKVIGADFSQNMLKLAREKNPNNVFMLCDATDLPFKENEFDYITMGFGLRNIENRPQALNQIYKVLKKGGYFLHLDFGKHNNTSKIFNIIVPFAAKIFRKNSENYKYLLKSKETFPPPEELIREFETHGFKLIKRMDFLFGTISAQIMQK